MKGNVKRRLKILNVERMLPAFLTCMPSRTFRKRAKVQTYIARVPVSLSRSRSSVDQSLECALALRRCPSRVAGLQSFSWSSGGCSGRRLSTVALQRWGLLWPPPGRGNLYWPGEARHKVPRTAIPFERLRWGLLRPPPGPVEAS
jgi:hypothetical protein